MTPGFLHSELPLVAAPMAGGPTTVELARAAGDAGAIAFLAAGYKTPEALAAEMSELRGGDRLFGVNLFVPDPSGDELDADERVAFARYARDLQVEADVYGLTLDPNPRSDDDAWDAKVDLLCAVPVPLVSFTFGLPPAKDLARIRRAGSATLATVTTADEARAAEEAEVDALIVQGPRAGGHSGTWDPSRVITGATTPETVAAIRAVTRLPLIGAGGVDGPDAVQEIIAAGADAAGVGTILLRTHEAGTSATHRNALASPEFTETVVTCAFTGRPARALRNGFTDRHAGEAPAHAYPAVHHLTRELRKRAAAAGDTDRLHLWAGTGYRAAKEESVAETLTRLAGDGGIARGGGRTQTSRR